MAAFLLCVIPQAHPATKPLKPKVSYRDRAFICCYHPIFPKANILCFDRVEALRALGLTNVNQMSNAGTYSLNTLGQYRDNDRDALGASEVFNVTLTSVIRDP